MIWKQSLVLVLVVAFVRNEETGCDKGFYFDSKTQCYPCPVNCTSCLSESFCTSCQDGNYGESCLFLCSFNCNNNQCNKSTGLCLYCAEGFFLKNQSCLKCPENCRTCASEVFCYACITGYKGYTCTEVCSNCKPNTECDQDSGYCIEECYDGLSGNNCDQVCASNCTSCRRDNINSCTTCAPDRYGIHCDNTCSSTCLWRTCNDNEGLCTLGCTRGYWGNRCEFSCSRYCISNKCKRTSGQCDYGCAYNYTGSKCLCSQNCNCNEIEECESCKSGYGELCEHSCSNGCINEVCHRETAQCLDGCLSGYSGENCTKIDTGTDTGGGPSPKTTVIVAVLVAIVIIIILTVLVLWKFKIFKMIETACVNIWTTTTAYTCAYGKCSSHPYSNNV